MKHYPFKSDGTFRICQFTDLHLHTYDRFEEGEQTYALLRQTLRDTNPDLVVITGDIACTVVVAASEKELNPID